MRAAPTETQRIFLGTQIADEARHVRFFDRFFSEVAVLDETSELKHRLDALEQHLSPAFTELFDGLLKPRVDRLAAEPEDQEALVEAVTLYHMVIEGMLALTGQHFIIDYNEQEGTLPGFVEGFSNVARDEHRHIAFGVRFLVDAVREKDSNREVIQKMLEESIPVADRVIDPPWAEDDDLELFGVEREDVHAFAAQCLSRRLKAIGLVPPRALRRFFLALGFLAGGAGLLRRGGFLGASALGSRFAPFEPPCFLTIFLTVCCAAASGVGVGAAG